MNTRTLIQHALEEDLGELGDLSSLYFIPEAHQSRTFMVAREQGILAGTQLAAQVFRAIDQDLRVDLLLEDGSHVAPGACVMEVAGTSRSILTAERTALNFLQHLSGIATSAHKFVQAVSHTSARILDTRKTTPGWRVLEKQAVAAGGAVNHRMGLHDRVMLKDNHLAALGDRATLQSAIDSFKKMHPEVPIEIEADDLDQVRSFLELRGVDYILLDNMNLAELSEAVELRTGATPLLEASGGITLETVAQIAETGVDYISSGAITHSAKALDLGLDFHND